MPVVNRIAEFQDDMTAWRRHLHARPELMYDTVETAAFVAEKLRAFGVDQVVTGIGRTGVVGVIKGQGPGPTIGLRADMDALPIEEARDLPYKSTAPGKMHACGHDGHTTMLLGAARYLAETRKFTGAVAVIFQPAEEGGSGGKAMVDDGMMDRFGIDQVYAIHNWPGLPLGQALITEGPIMAASDVFEITLRGRGSHAAYPEKSVDPVSLAAQIVLGLQSILARNVSALDRAVLSVTQVHAGTAFNVVPDTATIGGTVRTLDEAVRRHVAQRVEEVAMGLAAAHGAKAAVDYQFGYPVTVNEPRATGFAADTAAEVLGAGKVDTECPPTMGSEDFSFMLQARPGAYILMGQGDSAPLHHPDYDFNDDLAPVGASYFARLVERAQPLSP